ncbi:MAG: transcriptional regulator, partial [Candidatus Sedimenticola endophacoides]
GDEAPRFFLVRSGQIKLSRISFNGDEKVIELVGAGQTFAEALMFAQIPAYPVRAAALGRCELLAINSKGFLDLLRGSVESCFRMMGDMSLRLHKMVDEIDRLTMQSGTERIARFLCAQYHAEGEREFALAAPKGVLASRLSVKPETFSRILHRLADEGLVKIRASRVEILDPERLCGYSMSGF